MYIISFVQPNDRIARRKIFLTCIVQPRSAFLCFVDSTDRPSSRHRCFCDVACAELSWLVWAVPKIHGLVRSKAIRRLLIYIESELYEWMELNLVRRGFLAMMCGMRLVEKNVCLGRGERSNHHHPRRSVTQRSFEPRARTARVCARSGTNWRRMYDISAIGKGMSGSDSFPGASKRLLRAARVERLTPPCLVLTPSWAGTARSGR